MSNSWMEDFETRLLQLERTVASSKSGWDISELDVTLKLAAAAIGCLADNPATDFWVLEPQHIHRLCDGTMHPLAAEQGNQLRQLADRPSQWVSPSLLQGFQIGRSSASHDVLVCRYPLAEFSTLITGISGAGFHGSRQQVEDATKAVTSIVAANVTQHLLSTTSKSAEFLTALLQFAARLQGCDDRGGIHQVIAQESGIVWPNCRIAAIEFDGRKHKVTAITGAGQINSQSAQIQSLESLADFLLDHHERKESRADCALQWISLNQLEEALQLVDSGESLLQLASDYRTTGVVRVGITTIQCGATHVSTVLLESMEPQLHSSPAELHWQTLIQTAMTRVHKIGRKGKGWKRLSWPVTIGLISLLAALAFFVPIDFELPVEGQLVARGRRSLFAPESGTVTKVHFKNEQNVGSGDPLLTLANPELTLRQSELDGEIATTKAAVAAVNARRTSRAAEGSAAEGQVLKQRLKSLEAERKLIDERIDSLIIKAPFSGDIVRRNAALDLTNRPLQRGQRIAELIPIELDWELELYIPQSHSAYLQTALVHQESRLSLRYMINSEPNATYSATLESIEQFTYSRNSKLVQNAAVTVQLPDSSNAKSGTSVSARISCGQRSLGFVAARKLIEVLQHLKFVWWN